MSGTPMSTETARRLKRISDPPQGDMFAPSAAAAEPDLFSLPVDGPGDPNESLELRDMVSVAMSYYDRGMLDDAEEMLQEALDAGYTRQDALDLRDRIAELRGTPATPAPSETRMLQASEQFQPVEAFTSPLPGADSQPPAVRRIIEDSDRDITAGRLEAAFDASMAVLGLAPSYLPIYIRIAELRVALGDADGATNLVNTLMMGLNTTFTDNDWLTLSVRAILDPEDTGTIVRLAQELLQQRGTLALEPYVPEAINRTLRSQPAVCVELARDYVRLRPHDDAAQRLFVRSVVAAGDADEISTVLRRDVHANSAADLLFLRSALAFQDGRDEWFAWLERTVARLQQLPIEVNEVQVAIEASRSMMPGPQHGLAAAVARLAGGDQRGALDVLTPWDGAPTRETSDAREMLIAASARAYALRVLSPIESIQALTSAVAQAVVIDVRPFAESCKLFTKSISAESLMAELVAVARETKQQDAAIQHLQTLRDRLPEHLEIRTGLADLQVAAGRVAEGVKELRYIAERYEKAGNIPRMVEAMRHISEAVPNNAEMKAMLIEGYIQRGIPDEAIRELRLLGDIYSKRNRNADAASAYARGADIASTSGNYRRAMEMFDKALAADADNVPIRHAAVAFYIMTGAVDRATQQLREIVRIALQQQDPDEAVAALHQIIALAPNDAAAYHRLGEVLTSLGEYAQAERVYRRLATFTPDDPVLQAKQSALAALAADQ